MSVHSGQGSTTEDLSVLALLRDARHELVASISPSADGLTEVVAGLTSRFLRDTQAVKLLERHERLGKVGARRLLSSVGLDERVAIGAISSGTWRSIEDVLVGVGQTPSASGEGLTDE